MQALILAGGLGTRLSSVIPDLPKPMAPVAGKPFLQLLLESLYKKALVQQFFLKAIYPRKSFLTFGNSYRDMAITYVIEKTPLGTGGAIREALKQANQDYIYIFNGDTFVDFDVSGSEHLWREVQSPIIVGRKVGDVDRYGKLLIEDQRIVGFSEKGLVGPGIINAGYYIVPTNLSSKFPEKEKFSFEKDFLSQSVALNKYYLYLADGIFIDIGIPEDYLTAQSELATLDDRQ